MVCWNQHMLKKCINEAPYKKNIIIIFNMIIIEASDISEIFVLNILELTYWTALNFIFLIRKFIQKLIPKYGREEGSWPQVPLGGGGGTCKSLSKLSGAIFTN